MTTKVISFRLTNQQLVALRKHTDNQYQSDNEAAKALVLEVVSGLINPEPSNIEIKLKELQAQIDNFKAWNAQQLEAMGYDIHEALDNSRRALELLNISNNTDDC